MSDLSLQDGGAIERFQSYLKINTMQPNPDYAAAITFLSNQADELGLKFHEVVLSSGLPVAVLLWEGREPHLPSVMLNSHMDVVPVFPSFWKYPPFDAHMDEEGRIYARGSQDMKCVGSQYLEAIRRLKKGNDSGEMYQPKRNIFVVFVPDEEIGGHNGMQLFVEHEFFKNMNVGVCMDEGLANPDDSYLAFYGERAAWWVQITCHGPPGHGSQFLPNTAGEKMRRVIDRFMDFRASEERRMLESNGQLHIGDVTSVNLTRLEGGVQYNVVPEQLSVGFDVRIAPSEDFVEFEKRINTWLAESAENDTPGSIEVKFIQKSMHKKMVEREGEWWKTFMKVCHKRNMNVLPRIFPAGTDSRYVREKDIPAIGFSPMSNTPILLHDHNEFLHRDVFLQGIQFYEDLILAFAEQ